MSIMAGLCQPDSYALPAGNASPAAFSSPPGFTPAQVRHAYGIDSITFEKGLVQGDGTGQTIAIIDAYDDPNIKSDLLAFDKQFGLADPVFTRVAQDGSTNYPGVDKGTGVSGNPGYRAPGSWETETALDVEWAHAAAPAAKILLVEATSDSDSDLYTAVDYARTQPGVVVVSMSWGKAEWPSEASLDSHFTTPAGHAAITFVASSGDAGTIQYPAASPNVLSVGGTNLTLDAANNIQSETGWNGSGGGISPYEPRPGYQNGFYSGTTRANPDVAYDAGVGFSVYDSYNNGTTSPWSSIGGTSAGAPQWAALIAIADQGLALRGVPSLDGPTGVLPLIYQMPSIVFNDITSGSNKYYTAGSGYDKVTGRGTPQASRIAANLSRAEYVLGTDNKLWAETPGWQTSGRYLVDGNVQSFRVDAYDNVYVLGTDGKLWSEPLNWRQNGSRTLMYTNVASFEVSGDGSGTYYVLSTDHNLFMEGTGWQFCVDGNVQSFAVDGSGYFYVLGTDGNLWKEQRGWEQNGRVWVDGNVLAFSVDSSGSLLVLGTDRNLWSEQPGWQQGARRWVDGNVQSFSKGSNGSYYVLGTDGNLWVESTGWQQSGQRTKVDGNVRSFGVDTDGDIFVVGTDGKLWEELAGWQQANRILVDSNVLSFAPGI
jgi:hypothetical protein